MENKNDLQGSTLDTNAAETSENNTEENTDTVDIEAFQKLKAENAKMSRLLKKAEKKEADKTDGEAKTDKQPTSDDKLASKIEKMFLKSEGIKDPEEIKLAQKLQKETGKDMDELIESKYFKTELEEHRAQKAITEATSGVKGSGGDSQAKNKPEYWISKGVPPTKEQVPDRATRVKIHRAMMSNSKQGKKFYND